MRTCDPKSFVSVGTAAPDPPTWLFVTYMSAQEQSNKLEVIAIRGFIIFPATVWSSQEPDGSRGIRNATIVPQKRENCPLPRTWRAYAGLSLEAVSPTIRTEHSSTITVST